MAAFAGARTDAPSNRSLTLAVLKRAWLGAWGENPPSAARSRHSFSSEPHGRKGRVTGRSGPRLGPRGIDVRRRMIRVRREGEGGRGFTHGASNFNVNRAAQSSPVPRSSASPSRISRGSADWTWASANLR